MNRFASRLMAVVTFSSLLVAGSSQAASVPGPTAATQAATPAKSVTFPEKGRPLNFIVPYAAGGAGAIAGMELGNMLEKILQTPVQVLFRPGAGSQVGLTALAQAKPDGYTFGNVNLPGGPVIYLDPQRKAVFSRKSFTPIATHFATSPTVSVLAGSPHKTLKDVIDAASAQPGKITVATTGLMSPPHLAGLLLEKATGVKFRFVHFDAGDAPATNAVLGGHVDVSMQGYGGILQYIRSGQLRCLALSDSQESSLVPGVKPMVAQGYNAVVAVTQGVSAPAGTPPEIVSILSEAIRQAVADPGHQQKALALGFQLRYLNTADYTKLWDDVDAKTRAVMEQVKQE